MIKSFLFVAALMSVLTARVRAEGPLVVTPAAGWSVSYAKVPAGDGYTLLPPAGQAVDFSFARWFAPGNADQIPGYLDTVAKGFVATAARNPHIKLASADYAAGEFIGDPYSGKFVEFSLKNGLKDVLFIFGDGTGLWSGHYVGSQDGWLDAMEVLKSIKKG